MILKESKQSTIAKCVNLTQEQKDKLLTFFNGSGQSLWSKIDWNKYKELTWDDFTEVLNTVTKSSKKRTGNLVEGDDYFKLGETEEYDIYFVNSYRASVTMASNQWGQKVWTEVPSWYMDDPSQDYEPCQDNPHLWGGAKWCVSMRHTKRYWDDYHGESYSSGYDFIFLIHKSKPYKYALTMSGMVVNSIWDEKDEPIEGTSAMEYFKEIINGFSKELSAVYKKVYGSDSMDDVSKKIAKEFGEDAVNAYVILFGHSPVSREDFVDVYKGWFQSNKTFFRSYIVEHFGTLNNMFKHCYSSYMMVDGEKFEELVVKLFDWREEEKEEFLEKVKSTMDNSKYIDEYTAVAYVVMQEFNGKYIDMIPQMVLWDMLKYDDLMTFFRVKMYDNFYFIENDYDDEDEMELDDDPEGFFDI